MIDKLPTLDELEQMRLSWIRKFIDSGEFEDALDVGKHFGKPFAIRNWCGQFYQYGENRLRIESHRWYGDFAPRLERPFNKSFLKVGVDGKDFVSLSISEPDLNAIRDFDFVVPGGWMDTLQQLVEKMKKEKSEHDENDDLEQRTELAKMLHLID